MLADLHRNPAKLLPSSVQSKLAETWEGNNAGFGWDGFVSGYELTQPIDQAEKEIALAFAEEALLPAGEDFVLAELGRLRAQTVSRDIGQDLMLVFVVYADELMKYPPDAVREVLRAWPRANKFWPSMAEIIGQLDTLVEPRHALHSALKRGYRKPEYSKDWMPPPSPEDVQKAKEFLAAHGVTFDEDGRMHTRERPLEREPLRKIDPQRDERVLPEIRDMWIARLLADEPKPTPEEIPAVEATP